MSTLLNHLQNPFKLKLFFLTRLPLGFLTGLKVVYVSEDSCRVGIRYGYITKNPFRSVYFACLAMAGELASGALCLIHCDGKKPSVSTLVVSMQANFLKKATGEIIFECTEGKAIQAAIEKAVQTGEGTTVQTISKGYNNTKELVAEFTITWSFKSRTK